MLGSSLPSQQIGPFRELTLLASHEAISSEALQHPAAPPRCFLRMLFEPAPLAESCLMTCPETLQGGFLALLSLAVALLLYGEGSHGGTGSFLVGGSRRKGAGAGCWVCTYHQVRLRKGLAFGRGRAGFTSLCPCCHSRLVFKARNTILP